MKRVFIESPYAGSIAKNLDYLEACMLDSLSRGEAPFASHLMYTVILDDNNERQRSQGITAGSAFRKTCDIVAVYNNLGISPGMVAGIEESKALGIDVEYRRLETW